MKKLKFLSILFRILTIIGAMYVFSSDGRANAGYAIVPLFLSIIFHPREYSLIKK